MDKVVARVPVSSCLQCPFFKESFFPRGGEMQPINPPHCDASGQYLPQYHIEHHKDTATINLSIPERCPYMEVISE